MGILKIGSSGLRVIALQQLLDQHGFDPGAASGQYDQATDAAVRAFQRSVGLQADGQAGPNTLAALEKLNVASDVNAGLITPLFPGAPLLNIQMQLPFVLKALLDQSLADKEMMLMALGTIRAETGRFEPIDEGISEFNTDPAGTHPFDKYDNRRDLGNQGPPDGALFKGRGFVQLTGRSNYTRYSAVLGFGDHLVEDPDLAGDPIVAGQLLAAFLKDHEGPIRNALQARNLAAARKLVNGGSHGLADFSDTFERGRVLIPDNVQVQSG
jgi:peptidoglycan L-alanyl-D-glutamate endopeptidase CwlK